MIYKINSKFLIILIVISLVICAAGCNKNNDVSQSFKSSERDRDVEKSVETTKSYVAIFEPDTDSMITETELESALKVLKARLTAIGYTEAVVTKQGENRIRVEIPSVDNPEEAVALLGATAELKFVDYQGNEILNGNDIKNAKADYEVIDETDRQYIVKLRFNEEGTKKFADATAKISQLPEGQNFISIVLDGQVISSPRVAQKIDSDECYIQGADFNAKNTKELASQIRAGKLPFSLKRVDTKTQ